jgi:hypothetical protein
MISSMETMQPARASEEGCIQLYGWDSPTETWNGPTGLSGSLHPSRHLQQALKATPGRSWYGSVNCGVPGEAPTRFFSLIHALRDCAIAMIYCNDSRTGPVEIVAAIPPESRARLRPDFAFEFVAFAQFLDYRSLITYTIRTSSILYFQRNTTGAALISSKYW